MLSNLELIILINAVVLVSMLLSFIIYRRATKGLREENARLNKENQEIKDAEKFKQYAKDIAQINSGTKITGINGDSQVEIMVQKEIGSGAQGKVFHVRENDKDLALKIFCPSNNVFVQGSEIVNEAHKRFMNERLTKAVNHENVIKLHYYFTKIEVNQVINNFENLNSKTYTVPLPAFVMDLYENDLPTLIKNYKIKDSIFDNKPLAKEVLSAISSLIEAIIDIHSKKIIHRDIKPENIMIKKDNAALGDFGVAYWRSFAKSSKYKLATRETLNSPGTHFYMAPELQNKNPNTRFTQKSDIYSLGLTILRVVFRDTEDKLLTLLDIDRIEKNAKKYSTKKQNAIIHITHLIRKCCERDPEKRPNIATVKYYFGKIKNLWETGKTFESEIKLPKKTPWE